MPLLPSSVGGSLGQLLNFPDPVDMTKHLFGHLATALWRGNTSFCPTLPPPVDGNRPFSIATS